MDAKQVGEQIVAWYHGADAGREARTAFQQKFQAREFRTAGRACRPLRRPMK